ncbi:MAG: hypothetical protein QOK02_3823 [Mycobacterium sp.]|jgi:predicted lipoprotein with Yx(FWY)xxD motif|nr:hypothetical protein [Mycobacterium sp.]
MSTLVTKAHGLQMLLVAPLAATALLAACSSSGSSTGGSTSGAGSAAAQSAAGGSVTVETHNGSLGTFLTDSTGRALYLWEADRSGKSACSGTCASAWPPLTVKTNGTVNAAGAAEQKDLSTITRADGSKQVAYHGHPLYYFAGDGAPGTTNGQGSNGFGALWWVVTPAGAANTKAATTSSGSGSSTSSDGGGSGGY